MKARLPRQYLRQAGIGHYWAPTGPHLCAVARAPPQQAEPWCQPHLGGPWLAPSAGAGGRDFSACGLPQSLRACFPCQTFLVALAHFRNIVFLFLLTTPISYTIWGAAPSVVTALVPRGRCIQGGVFRLSPTSRGLGLGLGHSASSFRARETQSCRFV